MAKIESTPSPLGLRIGDYVLEELIGSGGMGSVYRARSSAHGTLALKVLHERIADDATRARFRAEAGVRIEHPNVIRVLGAGTTESDSPFFVMEYLEGLSLERLLENGPLAPGRVAGLLEQAAWGLAALHAAGIVHRDVKPANLFLCHDGTLKVLDFGVALHLGRSTRMTQSGSVLGTPSYLSPEQARGELDVDERADAWALGAVLYECLVGRSPFDRETPLATMVAVIMDPTPPLPDEARAAWPIVARCLQKRREDRWPSMSALAGGLRDLGGLDTTQIAAPREARRPAISFAPGEQRLVALVLAEGIEDLRAMESAVTGSGGVFSALLGDRAIGVFGAERWVGDETARAASAALRCRHAVHTIAVASGRATTSDASVISGRAMDDAQRGCAARLDGIAVPVATRDLLESQFVLRPAGSELLELISERHARSEPSRSYAQRQTMARETELAQMKGALDAVARDGRAVVVVVTGPPGIGKSQLRREMIALIRSSGSAGRILTGVGRPLLADVSLSLWRSVLERRCRLAAELGAAPRIDAEAPEERRQAILHLAREALDEPQGLRDLATFLGELLAVGMADTPTLRAARADPELMRDRLRIAIGDYVEGTLRKNPLALVVDDLQWSDVESIELLAMTVRRHVDEPLLVFAAGRGDSWMRPLLEAAPTCFQLNLRPLPRAAVGALAAHVAGVPMSDAQLSALVDRTEGNPLFVTQIVSALRDSGRLDDASEELPLPLTVESAVQARIDGLDNQQRDACMRLSAFGTTFTAADAAALGVVDGHVLDVLVRKEVLSTLRTGSGRGGHKFRSSIISDVAYGMLTPGLRAAVHERAAAHLASQSDASLEELARHQELGGNISDAAASYARAACEAGARAEFEKVLRCATRAFELGGGGSFESFPLHMACADADRFLRRREEQRRHLDAAIGSASDERERASALVELGALLARAGALADALHAFEEAAACASRAGDLETSAMACGRMVAPLAHAGRTADARAALQQAASILRGGGSTRLRAFIAEWRGLLAASDGDIGERFQSYSEARDLYHEIGDLRRAAAAELNLADVYNRVGDFDVAVRAVEGALATCRRVGNRLIEGYALLNLAYARLGRGDRSSVAGVLAEAEATAHGDARLSIAIDILRARSVLPDAPDRALGTAERAVQRARESGMRDLVVGALVVAARAAQSLGRLDRALSASAEALEIRDALGGLEEEEGEVFLVRRDALVAAGREAEAEQVRLRGESRVRFIARRIANLGWRNRFLHSVPAHRALLAPPDN